MAKILIVEDNPPNLTRARFLLTSAGHAVISAVDAEAGLTLARAERPDLILMDIQLPGMDGLAATALKGDEERIRAAGCDGYIAKPLRYQEFLATVSAWVTP